MERRVVHPGHVKAPFVGVRLRVDGVSLGREVGQWPLMVPTITAPGPRLISARSPAFGRRLDRLGRGEGVAVGGLRERQRVGPPTDVQDGDAGAAGDALTAAQDEEALQLGAVVAVVPGGNVADDVVVRERVGRRPCGVSVCGART